MLLVPPSKKLLFPPLSMPMAVHINAHYGGILHGRMPKCCYRLCLSAGHIYIYISEPFSYLNLYGLSLSDYCHYLRNYFCYILLMETSLCISYTCFGYIFANGNIFMYQLYVFQFYFVNGNYFMYQLYGFQLHFANVNYFVYQLYGFQLYFANVHYLMYQLYAFQLYFANA